MMMNRPTTISDTAAAPHRAALIHSRSDCPHVGGPCQPGRALCARLAQAAETARPLMGADFDLRGTVCLEDCQRRCLLAFRMTLRATWCFGDVAADADLDALTAAVGQASARPGAVIVAVPCAGPLQ